MPINTLEYTKLMAPKLNQHMVRAATSGWMEDNASALGEPIYNGGKEVKLPTVSTTGLGDYDRDTGFANKGSVSIEYEPYTMTQDRATSFQLDAMDVKETNFVVNSATVIKDFQMRHVAPELDTYRYATLAAKAKKANQSESVTLTVDNALSKFREHVDAIRDYTGQGMPLICTLPSAILRLIEDNKIFTKQFDVSDFKQGELSLRVKVLDNVFFRVVPSERLWNKYIFNSGASEWGFKVDTAGGAKEINWIICPKELPMAISRTDTLRVFDPLTNQDAHAWKIDYRKYHDLWVLKNNTKTLMACVKA